MNALLIPFPNGLDHLPEQLLSAVTTPHDPIVYVLLAATATVWAVHLALRRAILASEQDAGDGADLPTASRR